MFKKNLILILLLIKKGFALTVNGDSMIDACIADGDQVLMEPVNSMYSIKNGSIVSAYVSGLATLKYFYLDSNQVRLEPANPNYDPILVAFDRVEIQGKLIAVWRRQ